MENKKMSIEEMVQTDEWKRFTKRLDLFSAILLVVIILLLAAGFSIHGRFRILLTLALSTLSVTSFFTAFQKFNSEFRLLSFLFYKIYGLGLALGFITVLFTLQKWPYPGDLLSIISVIMISVSLILGIREKMSDNANHIDWKYFLKILIALVPLVYMMIWK
ncbi:MAG TPA: hypothetical protein VIH57_26645 [Bacteroidales bacterium]